MDGFFKIRTAEEVERETEAFASADPRTAVEIARDQEAEDLIRAEATDQSAGRVLMVARVIDPDGWARRDQWFEMARAERAGRRANQPTGRRLVASYERCATSCILNSIAKAKEILCLLEVA